MSELPVFYESVSRPLSMIIVRDKEVNRIIKISATKFEFELGRI